MLKTISSYYLPQYEKKCCNIIDYGNKDILKCCINFQKKILDELKNNNNIIKNNCHQHIYNYVNENRNIFNGKLKFSKKSLLLNENVYLGMRAMYDFTSLKVEIFLLNSLPHIMQNNEIFFNHYSLIKSNFEIFDLSSISKKFTSINCLGDTLCELFNQVYDNMLNN